MQGSVQSLQQVREIKTRQVLFLLQIRSAYFDGSVLQQMNTHIGFTFNLCHPVADGMPNAVRIVYGCSIFFQAVVELFKRELLQSF